jgi:hypothetical protein
MRLKELNSFPVDIAAPDFITNHATLSSYSRELSVLVSPTFLPALILLPDDARYAAYSLFVAIHSTNVSAVCDLDTAIDHSILSIENCSCVVDAYTCYQESYATTVMNGQQTNLNWLLDQALLVCVSAVLLAYGCGRVIGPIQADPPHYSDPQQIYATLLWLSADRTRPWQIPSTEGVVIPKDVLHTHL